MAALRRWVAVGLLAPCLFFRVEGAAGRDSVDLSETRVPFLVSADLPERVGTVIEWGRGINQAGALDPGVETPWGAIWQPALWVWGTQRVGVISHDGDRYTRPWGDHGEVALRLDLHANLQLTGTERIRAHFRPMDEQGFADRRHTKPIGHSAPDESYTSHWDADLESLFFEGEIAEMFPTLDPDDRTANDVGFAIGKFPVDFQQGYLVRDEMLAVGLAKGNLPFPGSSGLRLLGIWGFGHVNEPRFRHDADVFILSAAGDFPWGLLEVDVGRREAVAPLGDQVNVGVGWTHHVGLNNVSLHVNHANPDRPDTRDDEATLAVAGISREINIRRDLVYALGFLADGAHSRLASNGAPPLGPVGLSFAGNGLGRYRPALLPAPRDAAGLAVGAQRVFRQGSANAVIELAHRHDRSDVRDSRNNGGTALTTRLQYKFLDRFLVQLDGYVARLKGDRSGPRDGENDNDSAGVSLQLAVNF